MSDPRNNQLAKGSEYTSRDIAEDFGWFDLLSPELRDILRELNTVFDCADTYTAEQRFGVARTRELIQMTEYNDIVRFAKQYQKITGAPYAHTTANATIMRYGPRIRKPRISRVMERRILRQLGGISNDY